MTPPCVSVTVPEMDARYCALAADVINKVAVNKKSARSAPVI
jgi:hypothetical protein